jgi:zinc D-Ala-D-Ala carboxypeptidase
VAAVIDWSQYPNFSESEFRCKQTGECAMSADFLAKLQHLRGMYGKPMLITSGYRSPRHSIEAAKPDGPGPHSTGKAADVAVDRGDAYELLRLAMLLGFTGIGIQQKGMGRFLHLDILSGPGRPTIWSY